MAVNFGSAPKYVYNSEFEFDFIFDGSTLPQDESILSEMLDGLSDDNNQSSKSSEMFEGIRETEDHKTSIVEASLSNDVDFFKLTLPDDKLKVLNVLKNNICDISGLKDLDNNLDISIDPSMIEQIRKRGIDEAAWIHGTSSQKIDSDYYILPETKKITLFSPDGGEAKNIEVLTGGIFLVHPISQNETLRNNIRLSKKISDYVHRVIPFSENYLLRSRIFRLCKTNDPVLSKIKEIVIGVDAVSANEYIQLGVNLDNVNKISIKHKIGNCFPMSVVGLLHGEDLLKLLSEEVDESTLPSIEMFYIKNGDHVFIVIGRDNSSVPNNHLTWGSNAVVCDVWTGGCYPASEIQKNLYTYDRATSLAIQHEHYTVVSLFDHKIHSLVKYDIPYISNT